MEKASPQVVLVQVVPIRPLSRVKAADIGRVAQRMLDSSGVIRTSRVYDKCRPRIPGSVPRYSVTLNYLVNTSQLKPRRHRA